MRRRFNLMFTAVASVCCAVPAQPAATSLAVYDALVAAGRICAQHDACVVAGGVKGCRCPLAVRADAASEIAVAARAAQCPQIERLYCPPLANPVCAQGRCAAQIVEE